MKIISILIFLTYVYGMGHTVTRFVKAPSFEKVILRLGIGLGAFPFFALLLNLLHIPLDWRVFFFLALLSPLYDLLRWIKNKNRSPVVLECSRKTAAVIGLFLVNWMIYSGGAFTYPWLEDDDPLAHAAGVKYVAIEKKLNVEPGVFHYINPYPPGYDALLGVVHQTHPSLYWVAKFFNGFIVALGFLFFYLFVKELTKNKTKAALALFFLTCIPCYLSHFIWAHALAVSLFFPALYCALKARDDKRFIIPGALVVSGIFLTQPTQSIKFTIIFLLFIAASSLSSKKIKYMTAILVLGCMLSLIWWGPRVYDMARGNFRHLIRSEMPVSETVETSARKLSIKMFSSASGTATRSYTIKDYLFIPESNMINNPLGVGLVICFLALAGLFLILKSIKSRPPDTKFYNLVVIFWLIFTFLGMNSQTFHLPVGLFAFRFWMLFAVPVAMLAAETIDRVFITKKFNTFRAVIFLFVIAGVLATSGYYKVRSNTSIWWWGSYWRSISDLRGYVWLRLSEEPNTKVFTFTDNFLVIGSDMRADFWTEKYKTDFQDAVGLDPAELHDRLVNNGFQLMIVDQRAIARFGEKKIKAQLRGLSENTSYKLIYHIDKTIWIFRIM